MITAASGLSLMASMKMRGRNLPSIIRTLGPTSLSVIILASKLAVCSRTEGLCELQNRLSRYSSAPEDTSRGLLPLIVLLYQQRVTTTNSVAIPAEGYYH